MTRIATTAFALTVLASAVPITAYAQGPQETTAPVEVTGATDEVRRINDDDADEPVQASGGVFDSLRDPWFGFGIGYAAVSVGDKTLNEAGLDGYGQLMFPLYLAGKASDPLMVAAGLNASVANYGFTIDADCTDPTCTTPSKELDVSINQVGIVMFIEAGAAFPLDGRDGGTRSRSAKVNESRKAGHGDPTGPEIIGGVGLGYGMFSQIDDVEKYEPTDETAPTVLDTNLAGGLDLHVFGALRASIFELRVLAGYQVVANGLATTYHHVPGETDYMNIRDNQDYEPVNFGGTYVGAVVGVNFELPTKSESVARER